MTSWILLRIDYVTVKPYTLSFSVSDTAVLEQPTGFRTTSSALSFEPLKRYWLAWRTRHWLFFASLDAYHHGTYVDVQVAFCKGLQCSSTLQASEHQALRSRLSGVAIGWRFGRLSLHSLTPEAPAPFPALIFFSFARLGSTILSTLDEHLHSPN